MAHETSLTRRGFTAALSATGALAMLGCGKDAQSQKTPPQAPVAKAPDLRKMIVYRDPGCPCCEKWAAMARDAGYQVQVIDSADMRAVKARFGVPEALASCHTAIAGGYAFEGHVPFAAVARVLKDRPAGLLGLAVAGMPAGSPGMEVPGGRVEAFDVMAFAKGGKSWRFEA